MAQRHLDPTDPTATAVTGDALAGYLRAQADFDEPVGPGFWNRR